MRALTVLTRSTLAAAAIGGLLCGTASTAAAIEVPPPQTSATERAATMISPALVRVTGKFTAVVRNENGAAYSNRPSTLTYTCSGFGLRADGYLATAGHCIDSNDRGVKMPFIQQVAEDMNRVRPDISVEQFMEFGEKNWTVEGVNPGAPIASEIKVSGYPGAPADGVLARVVDDRPSGHGDVAILKIDVNHLPTAELTTGSAFAVGSPVTITGFPESAGEVLRDEARATIQETTIKDTNTDGGRPVYEVQSGAADGLSGGPVTDPEGRVIGLNSVRGSNPPVMYVIPVSGLLDLLTRNNATAELGPRDHAYRKAISDFHAGEYTDTITAIDDMQAEAPIHPRVAQLRTDAQSLKTQNGDASENLLQQILIWGGAGVGALVVLTIGILLIARSRRRAHMAPAMAQGPYPPTMQSPYPSAAHYGQQYGQQFPMPQYGQQPSNPPPYGPPSNPPYGQPSNPPYGQPPASPFTPHSGLPSYPPPAGPTVPVQRPPSGPERNGDDQAAPPTERAR